MSTLIDVRSASIEDVWEFVHTDEGQDEIATFVDGLREQLGSAEKWLAACQRAEEEIESFDVETMRELMARFEPFIEATPPGHDPGHIRRDMLAGLALTADPFVQSAAFQSDVIAGILGGTLHDIGNAVTRRYEDRKRKAGHSEIGGWYTHLRYVDLLGEALAELSTYAILAHTHYPKPLPVDRPKGYERLPYWYGIEYSEIDGVVRPYGLAPILTRYADRLDHGSPVGLVRHLIATADSAEEGGEDFTGEEFYEFNEEKLITVFSSRVRDRVDGVRTVVEHTHDIFAMSNFNGSIYARDDYLFLIMLDLILTKTCQLRGLIQAMDEAPEDLDLSDTSVIRSVMQMISVSPHFERSWQVLERSWDELPEEDQRRWTHGFPLVRDYYLEWVQALRSYANQSDHPLAVLANEVAETLL